MKCPKCQFENPKDSKFCLECGQKLELKKCPQCGKDLPAEAKFCVNRFSGKKVIGKDGVPGKIGLKTDPNILWAFYKLSASDPAFKSLCPQA